MWATTPYVSFPNTITINVAAWGLPVGTTCAASHRRAPGCVPLHACRFPARIALVATPAAADPPAPATPPSVRLVLLTPRTLPSPLPAVVHNLVAQGYANEVGTWPLTVPASGNITISVPAYSTSAIIAPVVTQARQPPSQHYQTCAWDTAGLASSVATT